jgi:energy-coupling factor transport system ATP-binding protein
LSIVTFKKFGWKYTGQTEWALKDINLEISGNEFVCITGPNESGKTTLALAISGLVPHNYLGTMEGDLYVLGYNVKNIKPFQLSGKIGFVYSDPEAQFITMSVEEELAIGLENRAYSIDEIRENIKWALDIVGISEDYLEKPPYELSGGQKQRVALAAVLATKPDVLILDEPTSMLDPIGKEEIINAILQLNRKYKTTIILIEHRLDEVAYLANRFILLYKGRIIMDSPPSHFFENVDFLIEKDVRVPEHLQLFASLKKINLYNGALPLQKGNATKILRDMWGVLNGKADHSQ